MTPSVFVLFLLAACVGMCVLVESAELDASVCNLAKETGKCRANIRRYHYNHHVGDCESFIYGGCGGNANNFDDIEKCRHACKPYNQVPTLYGQKKPTLYGQPNKQPRSQAGRLAPGWATFGIVLGVVSTRWININ